MWMKGKQIQRLDTSERENDSRLNGQPSNARDNHQERETASKLINRWIQHVNERKTDPAIRSRSISFVLFSLQHGSGWLLLIWMVNCWFIILSPFPSLIEWVSGGHYVYNPTLKRFFLFHFQFPFLLCGFRILHLFYLHFLSCFSFFFFIFYFLNLRTSEIHLFFNLQLFYWHFLEILWLFIFLVFYNYCFPEFIFFEFTFPIFISSGSCLLEFYSSGSCIRFILFSY